MSSPKSAAPFDDIRHLLTLMPEPAEAAIAAAAARLKAAFPPPQNFGRLADITRFMAGWQDKAMPSADRVLVALFAANHGIAAKRLGTPQPVTRAAMERFSNSSATINAICAAGGIGLKVFDLALDLPTADITRAAALEEAAAAATIAFGMEAIADPVDLLCLGDVGTDGKLVASAVFAGLYGGDPADWIGAGLGRDQASLAQDSALIGAALACHRDHLADPLDVMRRLGGREIAAMVGAIVAARLQRIPVILDGDAACAAAAVLHALAPAAIDHCLVGSRGPDPADAIVPHRLGKTPLLDIGLDVGEGAGAALAAGLVKAALACHHDVKGDV